MEMERISMNNALLHWKSTFSGLLTIGLIITSSLLATPEVITKKHAAWLLVIQSVAKGWIALIQQDAGKTIATLPGNPEPKVVPSHEVPDNPAATPVKE
jgi:hypothetical protein